MANCTELFEPMTDARLIAIGEGVGLGRYPPQLWSQMQRDVFDMIAELQRLREITGESDETEPLLWDMKGKTT